MRLVGGNITAKGNIQWDGSNSDGVLTTTLTISGTTDQTLTASGATQTSGFFPTLEVNKASGTLFLAGTIRTGKFWTVTQGTIDATTNNSTVVFVGNITIAGSQTLNNVTFDSNSASNVTYIINSTSVLTVAGTLTVDDTLAGLMTIATGAIVAQGNIVVDSSNVNSGISTNLTISGSASQLLTLSGGSTTTGQFASTTVNKTGGTLTISGILRTSKNFTVSSGTIDWTTNSAMLSFAGTLNFNAGTGSYNNIYFDTAGSVTLLSNLTLNGDWTNAGSFTSGSNTVTFAGSGTSTMITGGTTATKDFQNLTISKTGNGVVQLASTTLDVDGTLTVSSGTLDLNGQNITTTALCSVTGILKVAGTETLSCTPTYNTNSTILFASTTVATSTVSNFGSSFYNFISWIAGKNLVFPADTTTTIGGTLSVQGMSGNTLNIKSSAAGADGSKTGHCPDPILVPTPMYSFAAQNHLT
jgi:hypothetical protein